MSRSTLQPHVPPNNSLPLFEWECVCCFRVLGKDPNLIPCFFPTCNPLMHAICLDCATNLQSKTCPTCRAPFEAVVPWLEIVDSTRTPAIAPAVEAAIENSRRAAEKNEKLRAEADGCLQELRDTIQATISKGEFHARKHRIEVNRLRKLHADALKEWTEVFQNITVLEQSHASLVDQVEEKKLELARITEETRIAADGAENLKRKLDIMHDELSRQRAAEDTPKRGTFEVHDRCVREEFAYMQQNGCMSSVCPLPAEFPANLPPPLFVPPMTPSSRSPASGLPLLAPSQRMQRIATAGRRVGENRITAQLNAMFKAQKD